MEKILKKVHQMALLLAVVFMAGTTLQAQPKMIDKVVAKVGSEFVLLSDIEEQFAYISSKEGGLEDNVKCGILENIIAQKLIIYQARLDSLEVSDTEIDAQLDFRFESILSQMNGDEEFFKTYYGATIPEMKIRMRDDQEQQILAEKMQQKLINKVSITPRDVKEFYNKIPKDSLPYLNSEVELGEVVMTPKVNAEERERARVKLQDILFRITQGGEDFAELAVKFSEDVGSATRGGDLGFAKRGSFVPEFEAAVYGLSKDEISELVETEYGFHIIQLLERRGNSVKSRHILIKPKITDADKELTRLKLDTVRQEILLDSISFERAVKRYGDDKALSYSNNGRMKNPLTNNNFFQTNDLDPDIYFSVIDMKVGDLTEPIKFTDRAGVEKYHIIQLQSLTKPHKASLEQDYDKISKFAKESKKNEYFNEWVEEKMSETFIKVIPTYSGCPNLTQWIDSE